MGHTVKLSELSDFIICSICRGYLIDATTVNECLHTFCKSCIVKHIKNDNNDCPKCHTIIHERRPLDYVTHDRNKQDIVYKLVPQLYFTELSERIAAQDYHGIDTLTKRSLSKSLLNVNLIMRKRQGISNLSSPQGKPRKHINLKCPLTVKIGHLRKLLIYKYQLRSDDIVTLMHKGDIVSDEDHVSNLAPSLTFNIHYEISRTCVENQPEKSE